MRWSQSYLFTLKDAPADAEIISHILLVRGGFIRKVAPGIFTYGPLLLRALRKLETIVRDELTKHGCIEILMPMVQPRELWDESHRWSEMGEALQKLKNRSGHDFCLGATHEEVVTDYVRRDVKSYRDLGFNLFQIQTKFRDEIRPRFGLMRGREFIMKDAYSFDVNAEKAMASYHSMYEAYTRIFERLGLQFRVVKADSGNIGGNMSQEFHVLAESGEDQLLVADEGSFAANIEVCPALDATPMSSVSEAPKALETFPTPGLKTIADLAKSTGIAEHELVKTLFCSASDGPEVSPVAVLLRGSDELNPVKLKNLLKMANPPRMLTDDEVYKTTGAHPGSCGPVGLKIPIYCDLGLSTRANFVVGANKDGFHLRNVNPGRDFTIAATADLRMARPGDKNPDGPGLLRAVRGIEVGHIFYLGTKYAKAMSAQFLDVDGVLKPIEMGCYGLGMSRTVQAAVEQSHDKDGIIWPISLTPFEVHMAVLDPQKPTVASFANEVYEQLMKQGIHVFMDDREERPGVKFKDADLLGFPLRLNIGARGLENRQVELVERRTRQTTQVSMDEVVDAVDRWITAARGVKA
jgi:prolyl-tRNA synthetase